MKNLSITPKKALLLIGLLIVAILMCASAGAGEDRITSAVSGKDFYSPSNLSDNHPENAPGGTELVISLTRSLSLDLRLSSVGKGQPLLGEKQWGTPPIPIPKTPGSDLRYGRLGVGLSFGF